MSTKILKPIVSIQDLSWKAQKDTRYARLAVIAAENLGGPHGNLKEALQTIHNNAMSVEMEYEDFDGEEGVVDEINFVRDIELSEHRS